MKSTALKQEEFFQNPVPLRAVEVTSPVLQPEQIQKWLRNLPDRCPASNATRVISALTTLQQNNISDQTKLAALDTYQPCVLKLTNLLQQRFMAEPTPLSVDAAASVDLVQSLLQTLANAYMELAQNQLSHFNPLINLDRTSHAIERTIFNLGQVLLNGYIAYRQAPAEVWSNLYALYKAAERQNLLTRSVPYIGAEPVNSSATTTIRKTFEQIVLLSTSDPKGMQIGECQHLNNLLTQVYLYTGTEPGKIHIESAGVFVFHTTKDEAPLPMAAFPDLVESTEHVSINCHGTIEAMRKMVIAKHGDRPGEGGVRDAVENDAILRRAIRRWTGKLTRGPFVRMPQVWDLPLSCGIADIHYYAFDQRSFSKFELVAQNACPEQAKEVTTTTNSRHNSDHELRRITYDSLQTQLAEHDSAEVHKMQVARVMDESDGGVRLRLFTGSKVQLVVGDIISMQYGAAGSWRPGVVRWVLSNERAHVDVGIQILSNSVEPVAIQPFKVNGGENQIMPALLLAGTTSPATSASLVVSARSDDYDEKCRIIDADGNARMYKLTEHKLRTRSFDQITVAPCE